jgi:hypothetical protein
MPLATSPDALPIRAHSLKMAPVGFGEKCASGHEKIPVGGQQPCDHGERQGKRRKPAGSVTALAAMPGPRSPHHSSIRWQAD